jgi:uncharacterized Tic20 family protein
MEKVTVIQNSEEFSQGKVEAIVLSSMLLGVLLPTFGTALYCTKVWKERRVSGYYIERNHDNFYVNKFNRVRHNGN